MKLSCIVLMCDKDFRFIPKLIQNINNKVKIEHEIIIIDNREVYINEIIDTGNALVKSQGRNLRQMESRKWATEFATGDYIWFIDGDDDINEVQEQEHTADIVCFNFISDGDKYTNTYYGEETITENLLNSELFLKIGSQLWNKWLKTDLVKRVYALTPERSELSSLEDFIATAFSLKLATSLQHIDDIYYIYHVDNSNAMRDTYTDAEQFRSLTVGHNLAHCILSKNFTSQEKAMLGISNLYRVSCFEFIQKYLRCVDSIKKECLTIICDIFSKEIVLETMARLYPQYKNLEEMTALCRDAEKILDENATEKEMDLTIKNAFPPRRISFILHRTCNKNCSYCNLPPQQETLTDDAIYENFNNALTKLETMVMGNVIPQILGGEPTLWSEDLQKKIIQRLSEYKQYRVFTNGTNRNSLICKADNALCITHVTEWKDQKLSENMVNELYSIVVTKTEIDALDNFLAINSDKNIIVSPCPNSGIKDFDCTKEDVQQIELILKEHNLHPYFTSSELCNKEYTVWQVDCNTNEISPCCQSEEKYLLQDFTGNECTSCTKCVITA